MKPLIIIPARYESSRLPGKPLVDIHSKPMIQHVWERVKDVAQCIIATDDQRIYDKAVSFGAQVVMTAESHESGTDRCLEAYSLWQKESKEEFKLIINVQGDEPLIDPNEIKLLIQCFNDPKVEMASLAFKVKAKEDLMSRSNCFVVFDDNMDALYFSRWPLPYFRGLEEEDLNNKTVYRHIGMYAYTPVALREFAHLPVSSLEKAESLEQLRWLSAGKKIRLAIGNSPAPSVDTQEDLEQIRKLMES